MALPLYSCLLLSLASIVLAPPACAAEPSREAAPLPAGAGNAATLTMDGKAAKITFSPAEWPNVLWRPADGTPWDWSDAQALEIDLTNDSAQPAEISVRVDDDPAADGTVHCASATATLAGKARAVLLFPLAGGDAEAHGMRGAPPTAVRPGALAMSVYGAVERKHITAFQVFMHRPAGPRPFTLLGLRLLPAGQDPYKGLLDRFGQFTRAEWPGKLHSENEFAARQAREARDLAAHPALPDRDEYGGQAGGPRLKATGFFRTEKRNGAWWLVTPSGHRFLSLGMDTMQSSEATFVEGREGMFTWLPAPDDPLARHFSTVSYAFRGPVRSGRAYNFLGANLERRFGPGYLDAWRAGSLDRLRSWGFNTIGNWSDPGLGKLHRVPYVSTLGIGGDFARVSSGADLWGQMPDAFDPKFAEAAERSISGPASAQRDDPWCLGTFVDNELSWAGWTDEGRYGLARGTLACDASQPAKREMIAGLKEQYATIDRLNAAWGTSVASWEELARPWRAPGPENAAMRADEGAFVKRFARRYFTVVNDALKRHDPNHLYLGCRFAAFSPEAVEAAAEICDVVSFNIYSRALDPAKWRFTDTLGKPCLVGEFHFGALDRGMFHPGLVPAAGQRERAALYEGYLRSVLSYPAFVGAHWFQYTDESVTGRYFDGENYNIGFVDVTNTPYPEMVSAARGIHPLVYTLHAASAREGAAAR